MKYGIENICSCDNMCGDECKCKNPKEHSLLDELNDLTTLCDVEKWLEDCNFNPHDLIDNFIDKCEEN